MLEKELCTCQLSKHQAQKWSIQMNAVCGVDANDEEHENRHGSLEFEMNSSTSQPLKMNIIQEWERTRTEKVAQETAKTATEESTMSLSEVPRSVHRSSQESAPARRSNGHMTCAKSVLSHAHGHPLSRSWLVQVHRGIQAECTDTVVCRLKLDCGWVC